MPADFPVGIVVVQHMPALFTSAYAKRLDSICGLRVKEASEGDIIGAAKVLISPGDKHLKVVKGNADAFVALEQSAEVNNHRPSVDVLMSSVAETYRNRALAVIMTGMGKDGARGIAELKNQGGYVITQDEASSVIYGMNREVVENDNSDETVSLGEIADRLIHLTTCRTVIRDRA
jgi:two-component system chemotaxis response regulator CheB